MSPGPSAAPGADRSRAAFAPTRAAEPQSSIGPSSRPAAAWNPATPAIVGGTAATAVSAWRARNRT